MNMGGNILWVDEKLEVASTRDGKGEVVTADRLKSWFDIHSFRSRFDFSVFLHKWEIVLYN